MSDSDSNQTGIDLLVDAFNHLQPPSMEPNPIPMVVDEPTIVGQPPVPETAPRADYETMASQIAFLQAQLRDVHAGQPAPMPGATPLSSAASGTQGIPNVVVSPPAAVFKDPLKMKTPPVYKGS